MKDRKNLLIIDDSEDDRDLYRRYLAADNHAVWSVVEAASGEDGLEKFQAEAFDLVLLDYSLPGRSGVDLLNDCKGDMPYVPVVFVTGQGNELIAIECMKHGAQDYLVKGDITPESLQRAIHNALGRIEMFKKIDRQHESLKNFAHVLAHDLRAPIKRLRALGEIIADAVENKEYDVIDRFFHEVTKSAVHMERLIDTLVDFNEMDGVEAAFEPVRVQTLLEDVLAMLNFLIVERSASVTYDPLPEVKGNASQLTQLLQNLVTNGIKYSDSANPEVHFSAVELEAAWQISVRDNGIGIAPQYLQRIFEPFARLHGTDRYSGSGLGLAICKKVVECHDGQIWCESEPGKGTTFHVILPKSDSPDRRSAPAA
jgi:signal transduction histidine kinase